MTRYKERFHQAARDGYLDLLREATRSESDAADENGMSPVMWAAFYGNLDALRLLIQRGGSQDKADHMGSTALHFAALNGHMHCVSFLVNFGANIWNLDNDFHTALDLASLREHQEIVEYLDGVASQQHGMNKRVVNKMREKAAVEARKRIKKFNRMLQKASKKAEKEDRRMQDELESSGTEATLRRARTSNPNYRFLPGDKQQQHQHQHQHQHQQQQQQQQPGRDSSAAQKAYSEYLSSSRSAKSRFGFGAARKIVSHRQRQAAEDGRSHDVVYARSADSRSLLSGPTSEPDIAAPGRADSGFGDSSAGLFERPGFGSVAFFHQNTTMARTLKSFKERQETPSCADSIGTSGSLLRRWRDLPWSEEDVENLDDDDDTLAPHSELEFFLACVGATEYVPAFTAEHIDLDALGLCNDSDLHNLGLPLGPRKKILEALLRRRDAMAAQQSLRDLRL